jgi:ribosome-associated protein
VSSRERALAAARAAAGKRGADTVVLDVGEVLAIVDYFVITSGSNTRLVQTLAEEVEAAMKAAGGGPLRVEGYDDATWVLLDCGDVVIHVFLDEVRSYYELERLWGDVPRVPLETAEAAGATLD